MTLSERESQANSPLSPRNRFSHARNLKRLKQTNKLLASSHLLRREAQNAKTARRSVSSSGTRQDPEASTDANRIESRSSSVLPMHPPSLFRLSFLYPAAIYGVASSSVVIRIEYYEVEIFRRIIGNSGQILSEFLSSALHMNRFNQSREFPTYYALERPFYV